jgi:hypothetical protein
MRDRSLLHLAQGTSQIAMLGVELNFCSSSGYGTLMTLGSKFPGPRRPKAKNPRRRRIWPPAHHSQVRSSGRPTT